jgi:hypothetical protein
VLAPPKPTVEGVTPPGLRVWTSARRTNVGVVTARDNVRAQLRVPAVRLLRERWLALERRRLALHAEAVAGLLQPEHAAVVR